MYQAGGKGGRIYPTLAQATDAAESIFRRKGIVVSIVERESAMTNRTYYIFNDRPLPLYFVATNAKIRRELKRAGWERIRVAEMAPAVARFVKALPADGLAHEWEAPEPAPHYHVISGMPGYLPNANDIARTKRDARALLAWWCDELDETEGDNEYRDAEHQRRRTGSLKAGWFRWDSPSPYDLGYYVEIVACRDDCNPDAEY